MGFYSPPECGNAIFTITLRTVLDPCNLIFDLIKGKENNVNVPDSVISISSDLPSVVFDNEPVITNSVTFKIISGDCAVFSANAAISDDSVFKVISENLEVENKDSITFEDTVVKISSEELGVEILPAPSIEDSSILLSSGLVSIKMWPSVDTQESIIFIETNPISSVKNPTPADLPTNLNTADEGGDGASQVWRGFIDSKDPVVQVMWDKNEDIKELKQIIFSTQSRVDTGPTMRWSIYNNYQAIKQIGWQDYDRYFDLCSTMPWGFFELPDPVNPDARHTWSIIQHIGWGSTITTDLFESIPWHEPGGKDVPVDVNWQNFISYDVDYKMSWYAPDAVEMEYEIPWGPVDWSDVCCQRYWPPKSCTPLPFVIKEPALKGYCKDIVLSVGPSYGSHLGQFCPYQHHHSGRRDPFDPYEEQFNEILKAKDEYDMSNVVSVYVIKGDITPIEVTSISIRTDKQSYLWSFSISVGKDDFSNNFLEELKPHWDGSRWVYTDLLIMVNYNYWVCTVESYQESRTFGKDTWQISGRSPSMILGSPVCKKFNYSYVNPYDEHAPIAGAQLIDDVLTGTLIGINDNGWRADFGRYEETNPTRIASGFRPWDADDWAFYPKSLTFQDSTQIDIVSGLISSIGAFIITDPCPYKTVYERENNTKKLHIRPYYGFPPWQWFPGRTHWSAVYGTDENRLSGVKLLHTDLSLDIGRSNELKSEYNAVMVMGTIDIENAGFPVIDMYRKGCEGNKIYAPDVADEKLQSRKACEEIGRKVLSETGFWIKHTLKMYSLAAPEGTDGYRPDEPEFLGLCWPGDFIKVFERQGRTGSDVWYGDVEAVQIDVVVNNNVAYVSQTLGINEYADM